MPIQRRSTNVIRFLFVALFFVLRGWGIAGAEPAADVNSSVCATVTLLEGEATLASSSLAQRQLTTGETIYAGSTIQTGGNSKVELTFADRSVVRLNKDVVIELGIDIRNGEKPVKRFQLILRQGEAWVTQTGQPEGWNSPQILASGALLVGDRSVFRAASFRDGAMEMKVYTGFLTVSGPFQFVRENTRFLLKPAGDEEGHSTEPWRYRIEPYRKMIIQASGKETKPFRFTARADMSDWVRWNQLRDAVIR